MIDTKLTFKEACVGQVVRVIKGRHNTYGPSAGMGYLDAKPNDVGIIEATATDVHQLELLRGNVFIRAELNDPDAVYEVLRGKDLAAWKARVGRTIRPGSIRRSNDYGYGILIGADPEVFILDSNDVVIPAWNFLPKTDTSTRAGAFWDGFQAEFTPGKVDCHGTLMDHFQYGLKKIWTAAHKYKTGVRMTHRCVVDIPPELMQKASDTHAALGCAPSLNVYSNAPRLHVPDPRKLLLRFAGAHIHYGLGPRILESTVTDIVKCLDAIAGVASVYFLRGLEDPRRRRFYGIAGEHRLPAHGLEYRVLSSAILVHPVATHLMLDMARFAVNLAKRGRRAAWKATEREVQRTINDLDVDRAKVILDRNVAMLRAMFSVIYGEESTRGPLGAMRLLMAGAMQELPIDMIKNWGLTTNSYNDQWPGGHTVTVTAYANGALRDNY